MHEKDKALVSRRRAAVVCVPQLTLCPWGAERVNYPLRPLASFARRPAILRWAIAPCIQAVAQLCPNDRGRTYPPCRSPRP